MRYTPLGWAKKYEFTESDLKVACDMLDTWIDSVAMVCLTFFCIPSYTLMNMNHFNLFIQILKLKLKGEKKGRKKGVIRFVKYFRYNDTHDKLIGSVNI